MAVCQHGFWSRAEGQVSLPTSVTGLMVSPWISCSFSFSLTEGPEIRMVWDGESSLFLYLEQQFPTGRALFLVVQGRI